MIWLAAYLYVAGAVSFGFVLTHYQQEIQKRKDLGWGDLVLNTTFGLAWPAFPVVIIILAIFKR